MKFEHHMIHDLLKTPKNISNDLWMITGYIWIDSGNFHFSHENVVISRCFLNSVLGAQGFRSSPSNGLDTIGISVKNDDNPCRESSEIWSWAGDIVDQRGLWNTDMRKGPGPPEGPPGAWTWRRVLRTTFICSWKCRYFSMFFKKCAGVWGVPVICQQRGWYHRNQRQKS